MIKGWTRFRLVSAGLGVVAFFYTIMFWEWVPYSSFPEEGSRCFSANGDFYIVRYLTPFRAALTLTIEPIGTAELFNKSGKLLYSGRTSFDPQGGPFWGTWRPTFGKEQYSVVFMGIASPGWTYELPSSPGNTDGNFYCRPKTAIVDQSASVNKPSHP